MSASPPPPPRSQSEPAPQRWRENVEALTMAVVVALLFKYFILEISKIPSGSMQPTLMGNPQTGVYDRTIVDKLSYRFRDPERFEIVVFKHPLEQSRVMVKRLVGMPGEQLRIENGDLWTRPDAGTAWSILRRPDVVQEEMWRELAPDPRVKSWTVVRGGEQWKVGKDSIQARGDGAARFREGGGPIVDGYRDGYPRALIDQIAARDASVSHNPVGDVRLEGELTARAGTQAVTIELTEGRRVYEFTLPGPAAGGESRARVEVRDTAAETERVEQGAVLRLEAGDTVRFAVENLDDRLRLEVDGEELLATDVPATARQQAFITVSVAGEGADLADLRVLRDVYYTGGDGRATWETDIPPGHYVMLGDNTQDSADSRLWLQQTYVFDEEGGEVRYRGNYRLGENPVYSPPPGDAEPPRAADALSGKRIRFRDHWGEVHWFGEDPVKLTLSPTNQPLVPRDLIQGRALAVFWPIRPLQGLWRLSWLH